MAIYARVSTEHEAQLSALDNQIQYYDDFLAKHPDWILYERYIDEGISGTSIKKRKNFMRMMEDAKNGCFDLIITREVSRFARNTVDTLQETRKLKKLGVEVHFTEDNIWTFNDEDGELKLTLMATLAQNESKKTSQRVKAGQQISFKNGVFYSHGLLGYDYNKLTKEVTVNEVEAETVRFIFSSYLKGNGCDKIKYQLEENGYLTAKGLKKWSVSSIIRILQNSFYCGIIVYRKCYIPDYLEQKAKRNNGEVEQVIVDSKYPILISKEDFAKVQKMIADNSLHITENKKVGCGVPQSIWSKKMVCSCSSSFNKKVYHKHPDKDTTFCYQCYAQKNFGSAKTRLKKGLDITDACDVSLVQEWKLELMANVLFDTIWSDKESIIEIANNLIDETIKEEGGNNEIDTELKYYARKLETNNNKSEKLLEMYLSGNMIKKEDYLIKKQEIDKTNDDLNKKLEELESKRGIPKETLKERLVNLKQIIANKLKWNENVVPEELVDNFVEKITVYNDRFEWKLNYLNDIIDVDVNGRQNSSKLNLYVNSIASRTLQWHKLY